MFVCLAQSICCVDSQVCRLSEERGTKGLSQPLCGSAGASDLVGGGRLRCATRSSLLLTTQSKTRPKPSSLCGRYSISLWRLNTVLVLWAYSDSLLILLLCLLLLLPPLLWLLLKVCTSVNAHQCHTNTLKIRSQNWLLGPLFLLF